jgi:hypothetical protein
VGKADTAAAAANAPIAIKRLCIVISCLIESQRENVSRRE